MGGNSVAYLLFNASCIDFCLFWVLLADFVALCFCFIVFCSCVFILVCIWLLQLIVDYVVCCLLVIWFML